MTPEEWEAWDAAKAELVELLAAMPRTRTPYDLRWPAPLTPDQRGVNDMREQSSKLRAFIEEDVRRQDELAALNRQSRRRPEAPSARRIR